MGNTFIPSMLTDKGLDVGIASTVLSIAVTLLAKHPAGMLYIMVNLKVINTLIDEDHQITALALVATLKNLAAILFQNVAGQILDASSYSVLFGTCFVCIVGGLVLLAFFQVESGNDRRMFQ